MKTLKTNICCFFGTGFGIGFFPIMSGTVASIAIACLWFILPEHWFYNKSENQLYLDGYLIMLFSLIILSKIGIYICTESEKRYGHDAKVIVYDEFIGYLFAVLFLPKTPMIALFALIFFRIFDIGKPFFISKLQDFPRGWGIMIDDIVAGIYSNICLQIIYRIRPEIFI